MDFNKKNNTNNNMTRQDIANQRAQKLRHTINMMQPNARERYQHIYRSEHSWLSRVPLSHIFFYGGITIGFVILFLWGISSYEEDPSINVNSHHATHHIHHKQASLPSINQISEPNVNTYHMPVHLTSSQVEFFNQFYYTDRTRRNYTKRKDIYNARIAKINHLINYYNHQENQYKKQSSHHAKYMVIKCKAQIRFLRKYKHHITVAMFHRYPHFKVVMSNNQSNGTTHIREQPSTNSSSGSGSNSYSKITKPVYRKLIKTPSTESNSAPSNNQQNTNNGTMTSSNNTTNSGNNVNVSNNN